MLLTSTGLPAGEPPPPPLPQPFVDFSGRPVTSAEQWMRARRPEILESFRTHVYGRAPVGRPADLRFVVVETSTDAMGGAATRKQVEIRYSGPGGKGTMRLLVFVPNRRSKPVPAWVFICNRARTHIDAERGTRSPFWPAEQIVEAGHAAVAFHYAELDPDGFDGFKNGVHGIFDPPGTDRPGDAWGSVAAWAWGASRAMDFLETQPEIDPARVAVVGHSRGGKAALWAGAEDERFALVVSNDSGSTGAAVARGKSGESIRVINEKFPHWFCANYRRFNDREAELPVDQHLLLAAIAPRLLYVASASEDAWADPAAEFRACVGADPVFRMLGVAGLESLQMPLPERPLHGGRIGYHLRTGPHDLTVYDWQQFLAFAARHWK